jgi:putative secretion ATPase (PEP-CTERM system associated)
MYESHFGFTGSPFRLNPDPAFFFASRGHNNALSYLKFGIYQNEGFVVLTGEIGAGKTTLVRTLLAELETEKIVAAQIVSTQLEAGDLLRSVAFAFGLAPKNLSKAELIATIEAFLTHLITQDQRALLIVDEAQNLNREAVEELRMLSNFQLGNQALLQSFLVGQPELRRLLVSKPMEQFRQRVIASCHLGPMEPVETRGYIEHRLHQVGWTDNPSFDDAAFTRIFHWTAGVPRRVNLLCNRLLLSAYLASEARISAKDVDSIGEELHGEVGETGQLASPG